MQRKTTDSAYKRDALVLGVGNLLDLDPQTFEGEFNLANKRLSIICCITGEEGFTSFLKFCSSKLSCLPTVSCQRAKGGESLGCSDLCPQPVVT
eukprot:761251-Hanusia_phi.AAC.1